MADILPKQTLYIRNLSEKLPSSELKKCLFCLFSQFGQIAEVQCVKTNKLRGQAWVIFADTASATNALQCMNDFPFFDKPIKIEYAKGESTALRKHFDGWKSKKKQKTEKKEGSKKAAAAAADGAAPAATGPRASTAANAPNKLLLVEGLPGSATADMLELVFKQYLGLVEVRMVEAKPGLAFVEYDAEPSATTAMQGLQGFVISAGHSLAISYAK